MSEYVIGEQFRDRVQNELKNNPFAILSKLIYESLYNEIIQGHLLAGDKIIESKMAKELDVSRTPIKMALNRLVEEGLFEKDGKDLRVSKITYTECLWLYESRIAVEKKAAYLAAIRINNEELNTLKELIKKFKTVDVSYSNEVFVKCDKQFHDTIVNASRNPYIINMYKLIECPLQRYRYQTMQLAYEQRFESEGLERSSDLHTAVYRALSHRLRLESENAIEYDIHRMFGTMHMLKFI